MSDNGSLDQFRTFYAKSIVALGGASDQRLIDAFAAVKRHEFLGPGPWQVQTLKGYVSTVTDDPRIVYQDILVGLSTQQGINNGPPSLYAHVFDQLSVQPGSSVVHIGIGSGYYTALLAHLAGAGGRVHAIEIDPALAQLARAKLAGYGNVSVQGASGTAVALPHVDRICVSAGATEPPRAWLDALKPDGRLLFPLTGDGGWGQMLLITRLGSRGDVYSARLFVDVNFIDCLGARDAADGTRLSEAFRRGGQHMVKSLRIGTPPDASAWLAGKNWWLSTSAA